MYAIAMCSIANHHEPWGVMIARGGGVVVKGIRWSRPSKGPAAEAIDLAWSRKLHSNISETQFIIQHPQLPTQRFCCWSAVTAVAVCISAISGHKISTQIDMQMHRDSELVLVAKQDLSRQRLHRTWTQGLGPDGIRVCERMLKKRASSFVKECRPFKHALKLRDLQLWTITPDGSSIMRNHDTGCLGRAVCKRAMGLGVNGRKFDFLWGYFAGVAGHPLHDIFDEKQSLENEAERAEGVFTQ